MEEHRAWLLQAWQLALSRQGLTQPNPAVGAVLVKQGECVAKGRHFAAGQPHAEVMALQSIADASGMTLYVTLEPCSHHGRTPPCVDLIIEKNVSAVYFAYDDPNPQVSGRGQARLRAAGVQCERISVEQISEGYRHYDYWTRSGWPWLTLKIATNAERQIADPAGARLAITGASANALTHQLRATHGCLLTSAATVQSDDPQLTVRLADRVETRPVIVLARELDLPHQAQLWQRAAEVTLLHDCLDSARIAEWTARGMTCVRIPSTAGQLDLFAVLRYLAERGFHDVWAEVGGRLFASLLQTGRVNRLIVYCSPRSWPSAMTLPRSVFPVTATRAEVTVRDLGEDVMFDWHLAPSIED